MDMYDFYTGKEFNAYEYLGCHIQKDGCIFRIFAPNAVNISVIGDFNNWTETKMDKIYDGNFWECTISNGKVGMRYKYRIYRKDGRFIDHCDPYGFGMELRPENASIIRNLDSYTFQDEKWMTLQTESEDKPVNIYELHLGSWKTNKEDKNGWYSYDKLAKYLIPYLQKNGFNYVELLPIGEHPSDNSWGYQQTGFFSPTSRYGTMNQLKKFIDLCHQNNIGVLLDFVPVHFALDDYALANFDGTDLYEYPNSDIGNSEWGSKNFNHSRGEVQSFLQSNAEYWIKEYHFDGLRMDAISNLIYWQGNAERGVNQNAVSFIQNMNKGLKKLHPAIILAAEDSSSYPKITHPADQGGLGFDYKWDMGWMNDTLKFMQFNSAERQKKYHQLTFSMMYFYDEKFILPLSHDEVVHGKATIIQKMNGDYADKFLQARLLYMYMFAHPGKKLNFMGNEFAQFREWDEKREQDWSLLKNKKHREFHQFMKNLNQIYLQYPALYKLDYDKKGFQWLDCHQEKTCIYTFLRTDGDQKIAAVFNFSNEDHQYELSAKNISKLTLLMASDNKLYGGTLKYQDKEIIKSEKDKLLIPLSKFSAKYFLVQ